MIVPPERPVPNGGNSITATGRDQLGPRRGAKMGVTPRHQLQRAQVRMRRAGASCPICRCQRPPRSWSSLSARARQVVVNVVRRAETNGHDDLDSDFQRQASLAQHLPAARDPVRSRAKERTREMSQLPPPPMAAQRRPRNHVRTEASEFKYFCPNEICSCEADLLCMYGP